MTPAGQAIAGLLWEAGAIRVSRRQPFILAAGWASPVYVDCRVLVGASAWRTIITDALVDLMHTHFADRPFDAIVGAETAGIPFAAWLAHALDVPFRYVRKRPLGIGHHSQVEGGEVQGMRTLLVDDLTTDGSSKLNFARGLRAAGAEIRDVVTIFYHDAFPGARESLRIADLDLHALATWNDVLRADHHDHLDALDRKQIEHFLADPVAWSTRHGGRSQAAEQTTFRSSGR